LSNYVLKSIIPTNTTLHNCSTKGNVELITTESPHMIVKAERGATACWGYEAVDLSQRHGYLLKVKSKLLSGRRPYLYIVDKTKSQTIVEDRLSEDISYYILPPHYEYGLGYNISFQLNSYENVTSEGSLDELTIYPFPWKQISSISLKNPYYVEKYSSVDAHKIEVLEHLSYWYSLQLTHSSPDKSTLELLQSFDPGWLAYDLTGANWLQKAAPLLFANSLRLKDHVLVNNWANGWVLGEGSSSKLQDSSNVQGSNEETRNNETGNREIIVIFWPQYLQYLGFGVLLVTMGVLIVPRIRRLIR